MDGGPRRLAPTLRRVQAPRGTCAAARLVDAAAGSGVDAGCSLTEVRDALGILTARRPARGNSPAEGGPASRQPAETGVCRIRPVAADVVRRGRWIGNRAVVVTCSAEAFVMGAAR